MIQKILAFIGYVKIPKALIQLSMCQEEFLAKCLECEKDERGKEYFRQHMSAQATITSFLRKGRLYQ